MHARNIDDAWDYAAQYFEEVEDFTPAQASAGIFVVLEWLNARGLLTESGKEWLNDRSEERMRQVGIFRDDVTAQAAAFLDAQYGSWFDRHGIFISLIPDAELTACDALDDMWDEYTGVKPEKQRRQFEDLFANGTDFSLCDGVFTFIGDRYNHLIAADKYSETERVVMLTWHASGIVDNGGFEYLFADDFPGDPGFRLTLAAFETLGVERALSAFREALALFPRSNPHPNPEKRMRLFKKASEAAREEINRKFWSAGRDKEIEKRLASYIRTHRTDLDYWSRAKGR